MKKIKAKLTHVPGKDGIEFIQNALIASFGSVELEFHDGHVEALLPEGVEEAAFTSHLTRICYISKSVNKTVVHERPIEGSNRENPLPELREKGLAVPVAPGMFMFSDEYLCVMQYADTFLKQLARDHNALEQEYPALWPMALYRGIDYFREFPQQVILCTTIKDDFNSLTKFSKQYSADNEYDAIRLDDTLEDSEYGLESAVCDCCYFMLRGRRGMPDQAYTCCNKVFRNEISKDNAPDRLINFTVRDVIFVGSQEFVLENRQRMIDATADLIDRLGIGCTIETANDPFFSGDAITKNIFQYALQLKYELAAEIPHTGRKLAIGSINLHRDFFGRAFDIRLEDGTPAHSCCLGIGFERFAWALFCQYGADTSRWPSRLREELGLT